jgi:hypothetical protein
MAATGTVGACLDLCGSSCQGWTASDENNESTPTFHSRHIPEPWLNFETPTARTVKRNGLCDTLDRDTLRRLKDHGVELIETRLTWWELEATRSRFDWSRVERAFDCIEQAGLKVGLMCWLQHPPTWYDPDQTMHARYRCLEHDQDSTILSLWDPATLKVYPVHDDSVPRAAGIYRFEKWPRFEPYASLAADDDADPRYWTVHNRHVSAYSVERQDIDVRPRRPKQ